MDIVQLKIVSFKLENGSKEHDLTQIIIFHFLIEVKLQDKQSD